MIWMDKMFWNYVAVGITVFFVTCLLVTAYGYVSLFGMGNAKLILTWWFGYDFLVDCPSHPTLLPEYAASGARPCAVLVSLKGFEHDGFDG